MLTGRIVDPAGEPIPGSLVEVMPSSFDGTEFAEFTRLAVGDRAPSVRSDAQGRFRAPARPDFEGRLRVRPPGHPVLVTETFRTGREPELDLGDLRAARGAQLSGTAYGADGLPAAGASVCVDPVEQEGARRSGARAQADAGGDFVFEPLPAGSYEMFYYFPEQTAAEIAETLARTRVRVLLEEGTTTRKNLVQR